MKQNSAQAAKNSRTVSSDAVNLALVKLFCIDFLILHTAVFSSQRNLHYELLSFEVCNYHLVEQDAIFFILRFSLVKYKKKL